MTPYELYDLFQKYEAEYICWDKVTNRTFQRADLHAFALLDRLCPAPAEERDHCHDMVSAATHDEIFLTISPVELADVITEEQVVELIRCGVRYDRGSDSLAMFV